MRSFRQDEAEIFFGRGEQIDKLLDKLECHRFVAVVGASGSGKSSLVRAGLLPAVENGFLAAAAYRWWIVDTHPGGEPFARLAEALLTTRGQPSDSEPDLVALTEATLRSGPRGLLAALEDAGCPADTGVLLLVDQFEEIFRFRRRPSDIRASETDDAWQRRSAEEREAATAFVYLLLESARQAERPVYVVITIRSDFLGHCNTFHGLPEAIDQGQFLVPRLTRAQLRDVITGPLARCDSQAEPRLVNRILNGIGSDPDQLPVMQHLLMRMWSPHNAIDTDVTLRMVDYERAGGLNKALSLHADDVYNGLDDQKQKSLAERMFRCLCDPGGETPLTRRHASVAQVAAVSGTGAAEVIDVAKRFVKESFLITSTPGEPTTETILDVSHEALIRQWDRLGEWIAMEERSAAIYRRLADTAALWKQNQANLLDSPELDVALAWREREQATRAWADRYGGDLQLSLQFLKDSCSERDRKERRRRNQWAFVLTSIFVVLLVLSGLTIWALFSRQRAEQQTEQAQRNLARSHLHVGSELIEDGRLLFGLTWFWRSYAEAPPGDPLKCSARQLLAAWSRGLRSPLMHNDTIRSIVFSPDGETVLTASNDKTARLWDARTSEPRGAPMHHRRMVHMAAFSPDGKMVVTASGDQTARLWDGLTGQPLGEPLSHEAEVEAVAFSPNGKLLLTGCRDGRARLWELENEPPSAKILKHQDVVTAVAFSPDGEMALTASADYTAQLWDTETCEPLESPLKHEGKVLAAIFSPNGETVLTGSADETAQLWDARTGEHRGKPLKHEGAVKAVAFSPDGQVFITASNDQTAQLWDARTAGKRGAPLAHESEVWNAVFSDDNTTVITGSLDNTARLWDVRNGEPLGEPLHHERTVMAVAFIPGTTTPVTGDHAGNVRFWNRQSRLPRHKLKHKKKVWDLTFSSDGKMLLTGSLDKTARLWDVQTGEPLGELLRHEKSVYAVALSADGKTALTGCGDQIARLWNAENGSIIHSLAHERPVWAVAFSSDGDMALTGGKGGGVKLWNARTGEFQNELKGTFNNVFDLAFSPDGRKILTGDLNDAKLWDTKSRRKLHSLHGTAVSDVAFSADGQTAATGAVDNKARLWDVETGKSRGLGMRHRGPVWGVVFSPDGQTVVTGSEDRTVRIWDARTCLPIGPPLPHPQTIRDVAISPDGRTLATACDDGFARLWDIFPPAADEPVRLRLSIEWRSGLYLDELGVPTKLKQSAWLQRKRQLDALGGPCDVRSWDDLNEEELRAASGNVSSGSITGDHLPIPR
jgi:WD40 repeat protein/energy-coupling factor transporter ATP-binding protein EcfA2